jgi:branched-chain amino acid transport system ATP-binding protein
MSIWENLEMGAYSRTTRPKSKIILKKYTACFLNYSNAKQQQAGTLSGGEQQMLAMAEL